MIRDEEVPLFKRIWAPARGQGCVYSDLNSTFRTNHKKRNNYFQRAQTEAQLHSLYAKLLKHQTTENPRWQLISSFKERSLTAGRQ
ncbi:hypothetical protein EXN66_Car019780 [Channa argus]|uniref:Uncharacterized protein n=1 Tax=Channa argus TaxID=215402 RepID=A0A6G1QND3_CHAAH|nr:hypothetical protein EXN66_Car019780 [Channa argus]